GEAAVYRPILDGHWRWDRVVLNSWPLDRDRRDVCAYRFWSMGSSAPWAERESQLMAGSSFFCVRAGPLASVAVEVSPPSS
ncbi:hypothetical protein ACJX0J_033543, partial [Zea mays]